MATWKEVSFDSLEAAKDLLVSGRYRSCMSRAYYSLYARACEQLQGVAIFPAGRHGPNHDDLPDMIYDYLTRLTERDRWMYSMICGRMYQQRVHADYIPGLTIDQPIARQQVSRAEAFMKSMEAAYG